jgi:cation-transporting ATPase 13A2
LVGDPLDLKMFAWTGWELEEPTGAHDNSKFDLLTPTVVKGRNGIELGIIREFEFTPQLQRMSVVVRSLATPKTMILYCKGAPEKIRSLSVPSSIPPLFDSVLDSFTLKGYRVLALGYRLLPHLKWHQVQRVERGVVEGDLVFAGFLVMQNSLKPASIPVIRELNGAGVRSVMVTGDNILTALSVARDCGILHKNHKVKKNLSFSLIQLHLIFF